MRANPPPALTWRVPILAGGAQEASGGAAASILLTPGALADRGTTLVYNVTIVIQTSTVDAWTTALRAIIGTSGNVSSVASGPADNGTVTATILPPSAPPGPRRHLRP